MKNIQDIKIGDIITFMSYNKKVFPSYIDEVEHFCRYKLDHKSKIQNKKVKSITITEDGILFDCSDMSAPRIVHETEVIGVNLKDSDEQHKAISKFLNTEKKERIKKLHELLKNFKNLAFIPTSYNVDKNNYWVDINTHIEL